MEEPKYKTPKKFKKGMGRPTDISPEIKNQIVQFILMGSYVETAAAASGIAKQTFYEWLKRGARAKSLETIPDTERQYAEFSDAVNKAVGESEQRDLMRIELAAKEDWRAAAWKLERRAPSRWGPKAAMKIEGDKEGFSDSENIHKQIAELVSKHERLGEITNEGSDNEDI